MQEEYKKHFSNQYLEKLGFEFSNIQLDATKKYILSVSYSRQDEGKYLSEIIIGEFDLFYADSTKNTKISHCLRLGINLALKKLKEMNKKGLPICQQ